MVATELSLALVLAAAGGGVLGALLGGLPALGLAGLAIVAGETSAVVTQTGGAVSAGGVTGAVGLGPALGPHVAFAGGVAAAAYAARRRTVDSEARYHQAKAVATPLGSAPDVLIVGAAFGVVGAVLTVLTASNGLPVDPVFLSVVVTGLLHRVAFGYPLLGDTGRGVLDMSPYATGQRRGAIGTDEVRADGSRYVVEPLMPAHYQWPNAVGLGAGVGLFAGYVGLATGSALLAFGLSLIGLLARAVGLESIPYVHHVALPAGIVGVALTGSSPGAVLAAAAVVGVVAAVVGELAQRVVYAHADTHLDPPAVSIVLTSLLVAGLAGAGVLDPALVPYPAI